MITDQSHIQQTVVGRDIVMSFLKCLLRQENVCAITNIASVICLLQYCNRPKSVFDAFAERMSNGTL